MSRTRVIALALLTLIAVGVVTILRTHPEKPSGLPAVILFITLDTTRADHLSAYGYAKDTSPWLEELANQGVRATRAISTMPTTDPAHLSMFTGLYPRTHGIRINGVPLVENLDNLGSWAKRSGYRTGAFVSRKFTTPDAFNLDGFDDQNGPEAEFRGGDETLRQAFDWLDRHPRDPLFLWVHLFEPHLPYMPPKSILARFIGPDGLTSVTFRDATGPRYSAEEIASVTTIYDAEIAYADSLVEDLVRHVREIRSEEEPLIVVVGDHGEALGELDARYRFAFGHGAFLYQGLVRVPLILIWPGHLPAGGLVEAPVDLVDIPATLFDLLDVDGFATQGQSLLPLIDRDPDSVDRYAFSERRIYTDMVRNVQPRGDSQFAVQDARYKLILTLPEDETELYDLQRDPGETENLAAELPDVTERLRAVLDDWLERTPAASGVDLSIPEQRVEDLRALGYLE